MTSTLKTAQRLSINMKLNFQQFNLSIQEELSLQGITGIFGHSGSGKSTLLRAIRLRKKFFGAHYIK
ncbi:AAA family ATPase [Colwellia sp. MSW7]|uniref:AAA family ATPase n=1 Tax=Colwellia maritima TaxID=2912588 RepID=A0ABS9WYD3_9GAMM|nr:AAA family ATPase [Colwellia maritima]MCI2282979.1 AAA family ATPase [Colwellia maritima]